MTKNELHWGGHEGKHRRRVPCCQVGLTTRGNQLIVLIKIHSIFAKRNTIPDIQL